MNKKGFIRTLEAVIAVVIVLGIILVLSPEKPAKETEIPRNIREAQSYLLDNIITNEQLRNCLNAATPQGECREVCTIANVDAYVRNNLPPGYDYRCEICNTASTCSAQLPLDKSLYTDSRLIATNPAKVVRLIFWEK